MNTLTHTLEGVGEAVRVRVRVGVGEGVEDSHTLTSSPSP